MTQIGWFAKGTKGVVAAGGADAVVAGTTVLKNGGNAIDAALAAAPSRTPSASKVITLRTTRVEMYLAPRPELCPSASTTDKPPFGLSTTSTVSPLSDVAYFFTFATAICTSIH